MQAALAGVDGACLVVNADLPCVDTGCARAGSRRSLPPSSPRRTGRRTRSRFPSPPGSHRSTAPAAPPASRPLGLVPASIPELEHDVDTLPDLELERHDLERLTLPLGRRTDLVLNQHKAHCGAHRVNVVLLSGGVGGAKLAAGLHDVLAPGELTIIGNVGDDLEVLGLHVSPDLDSVLYGLAGLNDTERGWGRAGETWQALESARAWGGEGWFMLGDLDIGLHLVRSQALRDGEPLSAVTARLLTAAGLATRLLPATDDRLRTLLVTPEGTFAFQEWFVARQHEDPGRRARLRRCRRTRARRPASSRRSPRPTRS